MRSSSLLLVAGLLTAASAIPHAVQEREPLEKRFVNLWDQHEKDIYKSKYAQHPAKTNLASEEGIADGGTERKGQGRKNWWEWEKEEEKKEEQKEGQEEEVEEDCEEEEESPSPISPPVEQPTASEKSGGKFTILPIADVKGKLAAEDPSTSTSSTPALSKVSSTSATLGSKPTPSKTKALLPTYPEGVTNPVNPDSWLMQYASKISPYWNYTEVLWKPCERYKKPIPDPKTCVPTCKDVHSHTRLAIFVDCKRVEVCAFATFVLPDSECPGRVNSYELRCPKNQEELDKSEYNKPIYDKESKITGYVLGAAFDSMEKGTHITPAQCKENKNKPKLRTRRAMLVDYNESVRRDLAVRNTNTGIALYTRSNLHKRAYQYRSYLDNLNLYRPGMLTGPGTMYTCPYTDIDPDTGVDYFNCPFNCQHEHEPMVVEESVYIGPQRCLLCVYSVKVKDFPDERCPGIPTPEEVCPGNQEELVAALKSSMPSKSEGEILELLEKEAETPLPCDPKVNWEKCEEERRKMQEESKQ